MQLDIYKKGLILLSLQFIFLFDYDIRYKLIHNTGILGSTQGNRIKFQCVPFHLKSYPINYMTFVEKTPRNLSFVYISF